MADNELDIMKNIFLLLLFGLYAAVAYPQAKYTVSGTVKDKSSGEALIGATVRVVDKSTLGAVTNEYGFYSLTVPAGDYKVAVLYLGMAEYTFDIKAGKDVVQNVFLEPQKTELKEVTVSGKTDHVKSAQMGVEKLDIKDINDVPVLFGEKDVMKTIQLLPGVQSTGDGNSGFYVRGGTSDQNLILLDDATVYNPSHLLGFFSTFNSDAMKDVTLYKGTEPAQYGGRLSSVLDVKMNDGNNQDYHVSGGIGLISSKVNVEGPITKDDGSFLISARRTYADVFLKLSSDTTLKKSKLYFYDLNTKLNYKLSEKDRLYLSGYFGQDDFGLGTTFGINWGNATGTLRWNHLVNSRLFSNTSLIFSDYSYDININNSGISATIHSEIRDWNLKEELEFYPNPDHSVKFGLSSIFHTITPGNITGSGITSSTQPDNHTWENALYITDNWKAADKLNIDYGLRMSSFSVFGGTNLYNLDATHSITDTMHYSSGTIVQTYYVPEPRINASYILNDVSSLKVGYARNAQYLHLISNSTTSNPTDKWVATNNIIKPEIADQVSLGYFRNIKDEHYELNVETYYKNMQNQIDYKDNATIITNDAIEPQLLFGQGRAYGLEVTARKKVGKLTGWIGYTLSKSQIQISGVNSNKWYNARQDRTHDLSVVAIYRMSPTWTVSSDFVFYTGNAVTYPSGKYIVGNKVYNYYTERNGYRFPSYQRLDFSATKHLKPHKHYTSEINFSLYNVYGYENAYIIQFETNPNDPNRSEALQTALFRWVPSISYNFKF